MGWADAPRAPLSNDLIFVEIGKVEDSVGGSLATSFRAGDARDAKNSTI